MVLTGKHILKNSAFPTRVADLRFGKVNNPIIGWPANNGSNQKFNFAPVQGKTVKITTRTGDGQDV
ncbi:hypothetical protein EST38_g8854 [Candolleomyces aberdarensis]|uniref:Ricin B lectin domain-containing protein n=1 Tax=Candolleomyces aberdarensis TaxID=2316362 RepID=A0A4Q2DDQ9_9AGAR|nr:hypothetical protein EST38_g8854 [Candolleomyces aberdarensis]